MLTAHGGDGRLHPAGGHRGVGRTGAVGDVQHAAGFLIVTIGVSSGSSLWLAAQRIGPDHRPPRPGYGGAGTRNRDALSASLLHHVAESPRPGDGHAGFVGVELEVSWTTISNAYNRPDQLSADLRERIFATAKRLGYPGPDPVARSLRTCRAGAVGSVVASR